MSLQRKLLQILPQRVYASLKCRCLGESKATTDTKQKARDHMIRTEHSPRQKSLCPAEVVNVTNLSNSIKGLSLFVEENHRSDAAFQAGQWIDMHIPGVDTVGGFSICNSPGELQEKGLLELAVKFSDHPPAFWIHTKCNIGSKVKVRVGGNFYYQSVPQRNTVLIAGGVGINPLLSIFRHKRNTGMLSNPSSSIANGKTILVYSAKTFQDLIFFDQIMDLSQEMNSQCTVHVTKESIDPALFKSYPLVNFIQSKVSLESLRHSVDSVNCETTDCYICGPPSFIERTEQYLIQLGYLRSNVYYEKWW